MHRKPTGIANTPICISQSNDKILRAIRLRRAFKTFKLIGVRTFFQRTFNQINRSIGNGETKYYIKTLIANTKLLRLQANRIESKRIVHGCPHACQADVRVEFRDLLANAKYLWRTFCCTKAWLPARGTIRIAFDTDFILEISLEYLLKQRALRFDTHIFIHIHRRRKQEQFKASLTNLLRDTLVFHASRKHFFLP